MAKLSPKDPQFGIPVAARIHKDRAFRLNAEAGKKGKSLSRHVAECLEEAEVNEKKVKELAMQLDKEKEAIMIKEKEIKKLESWLAKEKEIIKAAVSKFIIEISEGNQKKTTQLIQTYNTILKDEKSK